LLANSDIFLTTVAPSSSSIVNSNSTSNTKMRYH
jgi:hypothetical protein